MTELPAKRQHFLALDLLRGIAALAVIFLHWLEGNGNPWFHNSHLAVDFFFILSGFVMAYSYTDRLKAGLGLGRFLILRLIRLYPLIIIGILLGFVRFALKTMATHDPSMPMSWLVVKMVQNLFMIPNFQDGLSADMFILNLALWSLFFEFLAYILFGLFMYRSSLVVLLAIAIVGGIGVWGWMVQEFGPVKATLPWLEFEKLGYVSGFSRVMLSFTMGLLTFEVFKRMPRTLKVNGWIYAAVLFVFLSLPVGALPVNLVFLILVLGFPALIVLAAMAYIPDRGQKLATLFGDLSYPLYVVHTPILWTLSGLFKILHLNVPFSEIGYGVVILPCAILASYLAFKFYDEPVRAYLTKLYKQANPQVAKT
ncbi:hypothetical protein MMA231_04146 (plasmid) [Asticcacaulis sp. MM231]|uniref:acyltransferase family protein n=1 Tax=Asticcacaulis sp. MM231 TaxID=3157666 RepID=UPI0032D574ED